MSLSEGETGDGQPWPYVECESCAATAMPDNWNNRQALARGPQQAGGEDWPKVMGEYLAIMTRCDDAICESGKATLSRADMEAIERYNLADEHLSMMQADRIAALQAEVARLSCANDALADALREANKGYVHELNRAETAEAALAKYGAHYPGCDGFANGIDGDCDCGWSLVRDGDSGEGES